MLDDLLTTFCCLLAIHPSAMVELNMLKLDTLDPLGDDSPPEWPAEQLNFALQEMHLDKHQVGGWQAG